MLSTAKHLGIFAGAKKMQGFFTPLRFVQNDRGRFCAPSYGVGVYSHLEPRKPGPVPRGAPADLLLSPAWPGRRRHFSPYEKRSTKGPEAESLRAPKQWQPI